MLDKLFQLNEQFFVLYGTVRENTENLTEKQYHFMTDKLFEQYKSEYAKLALKKEIEDKKELFILNFRNSGYVPRKFLWFKNSAYELMKAQMTKELDDYFDKKFEKLQEIDNRGVKNEKSNV